MSAEDTWNKLHKKERQLSEKEWDLYQRIEKLDLKKMEVMDQLLNDSHWLNDLDFLFEGSRFQHQVRIMEYSLDEELEKLRKEHKSIEMKLDSIHQEKRRLVTEEIT